MQRDPYEAGGITGEGYATGQKAAGDPAFNSPEYIAALNKAHPEYGAGPAASAPKAAPFDLDHYFSDPLLQGYLNFGRGAVNKLAGPQTINPTLQHALDQLKAVYGQFGDTVHSRAAELRQPGYTSSQQDILRTNISDPLTAQRDAARQQVTEHMASRGIQPGSGIMEQALADVDRQYGQTRATGERELATGLMKQDEDRKNQATQLEQMLSQFGLSTAGAEAGIGEDLQHQSSSDLLSAMGIFGNLADLPFKAQQNATNAMNAVNGQHVPTDQNSQLIQLLMQLAGQGENAYDNASGDDSFWSVLGQSMPDLLKGFGGLFGGSDAEGDGGR